MATDPLTVLARGVLRLYPRPWRNRYGPELLDVLDQHRVTWATLVNLLAGALDARLNPIASEGGPMRKRIADPAIRRGLGDGLVVAAALAVLAFLTNVVFPAGPNESDGDPEYMVELLIVYALTAALLVLIGARARRRSETVLAGAKGGGAAGFVIALSTTVTFLVIDNIFFGIVSKQHDKRVAFAASGWTSMRTFVNLNLLIPAVPLTLMGTLVGAALGLVGAALFRPRAVARST